MWLLQFIYVWLVLLGICKGDDVTNKLALCVTDIRNENYFEAANKFLKLQSVAEMEKIVAMAYSEDLVNQVLRFSEELPYMRLRVLTLRRLAQEACRPELPGPDPLTILDYIEKKYNYVEIGRENSLVLNETQRMLNSKEEKIVEVWTKQIKSKTFSPIVKFADEKSSIFLRYLKWIVDLLFVAGDEESWTTILDYSDALPKIGQSAATLIDLYSKMRETKARNMKVTLSLAHQAHSLQVMKNYHIIDKDLQSGLDNVLNLVPKSIRLLATGAEACISNDISGQLFVPRHHDSDRDIVALHYKPENNGQFLSSKWKFESSEGNAQYRIISVPNDDHLYAASNSFRFGDGNNKRGVFTWRKSERVSQGVWHLHDENWTEDLYLIFNTAHDEYLNAEREDSLVPESLLHLAETIFKKKPVHDFVQKRAYTWAGGGKGENNVWKISKCS